ncbi:MAG: hypothetical protein ACYC1U_06750 [Candidatus Aquicultorales bacterium]
MDDLELRPIVNQMAAEMELELRRHDPEKGSSYKDMTVDELMPLLYQQFIGISTALRAGDANRVIEKAVDGANITAMIRRQAREGKLR